MNIWPFKKEKTHQVYFETDNWAVRKYSPVQLARDFVPKQFSDMPLFIDKQEKMIDSQKSIRACPGISEYFGLGWVIPAWCDIEMYPMEDGSVRARYSDHNYNHGFHPIPQVGNFMEKTFKIRMPVKLDNPWHTYTKKGWSLLYLPMMYHEEHNWQIMPGIIDHDLGPTISPINIMLKESKITLIKQGEPLCQIIPIYREEVSARSGSVREITKTRNSGIISSMFMSFKGWTKLMRDHKRYNIDAHDTDLPE
jgi:hypothetical protein